MKKVLLLLVMSTVLLGCSKSEDEVAIETDLSGIYTGTYIFSQNGVEMSADSMTNLITKSDNGYSIKANGQTFSLDSNGSGTLIQDETEESTKDEWYLNGIPGYNITTYTVRIQGDIMYYSQHTQYYEFTEISVYNEELDRYDLVKDGSSTLISVYDIIGELKKR